MVILLMASLFLAALMFMLKIFMHYNLLRSNDDELRDIDFGEFFYSRQFSRKRITVAFKIYSLHFIKNKDNQLVDRNGSIEKINLYVKLILVFIASSVLILAIGLFTGTIT